MKKILIICPTAVPFMSTWGATQRMHYLANYLGKQKWDVSIAAPIHSKVKKEVCAERYYKNIFENSGINNSVSTEEILEGTKKTIIYRTMSNVANFIKPYINLYYGEPDCYEAIIMQNWVHKNKKNIMDYMVQNNIKLVLVSVPSFSLGNFAKIIKKKKPDVKVVLDYRDPWYLWNPKNIGAKYRERCILKYVDMCVGFSDKYVEEMKKTYSIINKMPVVWNGYSEESWKEYEQERPKTYIRGKRCRIVYVGNITLASVKNNYRDISKFLDVLNKYKEMELTIVGASAEEMSKLGERDNVRVLGKVSQKESFAYMCEADVLLNIHDSKDTSGKYLISGKVFDYIRSGRPIWHIGMNGDLVSEMVLNEKLGVTCENNKNDLDETMKRIQELWNKNELMILRKNKEIQGEKSREYQNKCYERHLVRILDN